MTDYRVALEVYNGPLDLLLFLIKREEIDIHDIPIARITQQYVQYVELLRQIDPEIISEFLVLAATLMEIKSRALLPTPPVDEGDEEMVDPRLELVRQLLEYKQYKDVAHTLEEAAHDRARKHARRPVMSKPSEDEVELETLEIWDLFDAFNRMLEQIGRIGAVHEVGVDDTPIALHADDILDSIGRAGGAQPFEEVFAGRTRAEMIGLFLALLELIRRRRVRATQERPFAPIRIELLDATPLDTAELQDNDLEKRLDVGETAASEPPPPALPPGKGEASGELETPAEPADPVAERDVERGNDAGSPTVPHPSPPPEENVHSSVDSTPRETLPDAVPKRGVGDGIDGEDPAGVPEPPLQQRSDAEAPEGSVPDPGGERGMGDEATQDPVTPMDNDQLLEPERYDDPQ